MLAPAKTGQKGKRRSMSGDKSVKSLADAPENFGMAIPFVEPGHFRILRQGSKSGFRAAYNRSIRQNQVHRLLERGFLDLGKALRYGRILKWNKLHPVAGGLLPALDPQLAKVAIAVINHDRFGGGSSDLDIRLHVVPGTLAPSMQFEY